MGTLPDRARVVVIGAGIAGNGMAWHLAQLGWRDMVLLDKGPLPNPGGSTGHASNFMFPTDYSRQMTAWCLDSIRQFDELGVFTRSGGIEVARTEARMVRLRRRLGAARAWGVDSELLEPARIRELVPFIDTDVLLGGLYTPGAGVVDPVRAGTLMREGAMGLGALVVSGATEVLGIDVADGSIRGVRTDRGDIRTDTIVVCCGVWSPRIARMAGASIPLTPAVHQMISLGPVPRFAGVPGEIGFPVVRDMDALMYERQSGSDLEIGSYAHRPILVEPDEIPSNEQAVLSPTELPFTMEDFEPHLERALELFPEIVGDESVTIRHAVNGLISLTADGYQLLGESPEVRGLWSAAAMWIKEAPAITRTVAEWMTRGTTRMDPAASDIARFYDCQRTAAHVKGRAAEWFPRFYGIVHPAEQWASSREVRVGPAHGRQGALGAVFFESAGWERAQWYTSNAALLERYADRVMPREAEWDARWWSPIINAEHLAMRDRVGLVDGSSFAILDVAGRGALACLERLAVASMDVPVGRVVYTQLLDEAGGIRADVTVTRLGNDRFRVVSGAGTGMRDLKWLADHLPEDGDAALCDSTSAWTTLGLFGPRARDVLAPLTATDMSSQAFPFATCRVLDLGPLSVLAVRISYVGELGWELHAPSEQGARLWDLLWEAGQPHGLVPVGMGVYGTTARLEKCYRAMGSELALDRDLVEAGLAPSRIKPGAFIGREALLGQQERVPAALLCTLGVDDHASAEGMRRYMLGGEPVTHLDGRPLVDSKGRRSYVTSAGSGPSLGRHLLMSYLPIEVADEGTRLAVEYFGERYPVSVARVGRRPLFDPSNERQRG